MVKSSGRSRKSSFSDSNSRMHPLNPTDTSVLWELKGDQRKKILMIENVQHLFKNLIGEYRGLRFEELIYLLWQAFYPLFKWHSYQCNFLLSVTVSEIASLSSTKQTQNNKGQHRMLYLGIWRIQLKKRWSSLIRRQVCITPNFLF